MPEVLDIVGGLPIKMARLRYSGHSRACSNIWSVNYGVVDFAQELFTQVFQARKLWWTWVRE